MTYVNKKGEKYFELQSTKIKTALETTDKFFFLFYRKENLKLKMHKLK